MSKFLKITLAALVIVTISSVAFAKSFRDDNVFSGINVFEKETRFTSGVLNISGVRYVWPSADGSAGQQLTTDGSLTLSWASAGAGSATAYDDITDPDANSSIDFTTFTNTWDFGVTAGDMFTIELTAAFGNITGVLIEQKTGNPTDGTLLELKLAAAETDPDFVSFLAGASEVFNIDAAGTITIAGAKSAGTTIDANSLDWIGAGAITTAASSALTLAADDGGQAGEDLIITAANITLLATGAMSITPDAALTTAIDLTDANLTNALSVGVNAIIGSTGIFTYSNWDIAADGDATFVDVTVGGNISVVGTFLQDSLAPASASPANIALNAGTSGLIKIGNVSSGNIELGGVATVVDLKAGTNLVVSEGDAAITSTSNEDILTIIANSVTNQKGISVTMDGITSGSMLYLDNNQAGSFTGKYIQLFDGSQDDFSIKLHGIIQSAGSAGNDSWILDTGDILVSAGDIGLTAGMITVAAALNTDQSSFTNSGDIGVVGAGEAYFTIKGSIAGGNTTNTAYLLELVYSAESDAQDGYLVLKDNSFANIKFSIGAGGATAWNLDDVIIAIDADTVIQTGTAGTIDMNVRSATASHVAFLMDYELDNGGSGTQYGFQVSLDDDAAGGDENFIAYDALISAGTDVDTTAFQATNYDIALKTTSLTTGVILDIDVADSYTARGIDADLGPHIGTVNEGFIHIFTDASATDVVGQIIRINLQDSAVDTTAISGKAIYAKEVSPVKTGTYLVHFESTNNGSLFLTGPVSLQAAAPLVGASPLALEGSTVDGDELTIAVTDPTSDTTVTLPDGPSSGNIASIVSVGTTQTSQAGVGTSTVTGSSIAVPAGHAAAGQVYTWEVSGTKTGANTAMIVKLQLDTSEVMTLTASDAAAGDWVAKFVCYLTGSGAQKIQGQLLVNGKVAVTDYAAGAIDISGAVNIFVEIQSQNGGDTVTSETVTATFNE